MASLLSVPVIDIDDAGEETFRLTASAPQIAAEARPGQFVHVRIGDPGEPGASILRRPLSIHSVEGERIGLLVRKAGKGTVWLSRRRPGDVLDVLGPLGTGFALPSASTKTIVVAGGIGCGPLYFLIQKLKEQGSHVAYLAGGRHSRELFLADRYQELADETFWATDDGSHGKQGFVTELLVALLTGGLKGSYSEIFACGPEPMLKAVSAIAAEHNVPCQISTEALMACGIGVCLSCVHKVKTDGGEGYARVCAEGPVFKSTQVVWDNGADADD